jgi:hypothetical protein
MKLPRSNSARSVLIMLFLSAFFVCFYMEGGKHQTLAGAMSGPSSPAVILQADGGAPPPPPPPIPPKSNPSSSLLG